MLMTIPEAVISEFPDRAFLLESIAVREKEIAARDEKIIHLDQEIHHLMV